jgi:hypothetical protein
MVLQNYHPIVVSFPKCSFSTQTSYTVEVLYFLYNLDDFSSFTMNLIGENEAWKGTPLGFLGPGINP